MTTSHVEHPAQPVTQPVTQAAAAAQPVLPRPVGTTNGSESRKERGVVLRVLVYVVAAHLLAFFIWLLFVVGGSR